MRLFIISLLLSLLAQSGGQPVVVPIQSPSFENNGTGWTFGAGSRVTQYNGSPAAIAGYGSSFSQTLTTTPAQLQANPPTDGVYVLKFSVVNNFPTYPGYYTAKISFGTQELCESSSVGVRALTQVTVVCTASDYIVIDQALPSGGPVQGAFPLVVSFSADWWPLLFTGISLTFTPN